MRTVSLPLLVLVAALAGCERSYPVELTPVSQSGQASAAATAPVLSAVPPAREVEWKPRQGPLSEPEKAVVGTWVATVGDYATRSAFMADKVLIGLGGGKGGDAVAIAEAITRDNRLKTNCVWLELFERRAGIRRECAVVNGQASALDKTDPLTGAKSDLGTTFGWYWDEAARTVRLRFDSDMLVPSIAAKELRTLRFRTWVLALGERSGDGYKIQESIPEHDYKLPVEYVFEIFPGKFLGQP